VGGTVGGIAGLVLLGTVLWYFGLLASLFFAHSQHYVAPYRRRKHKGASGSPGGPRKPMVISL